MDCDKKQLIAAIMAGSKLAYMNHGIDEVISYYRELIKKGIPEIPASIMASSEIVYNCSGIDRVIECYNELIKKGISEIPASIMASSEVVYHVAPHDYITNEVLNNFRNLENRL